MLRATRIQFVETSSMVSGSNYSFGLTLALNGEAFATDLERVVLRASGHELHPNYNEG